MPYIAEISGYDIANAAAKTLRFAMGAGVPLSDQPYAPGQMVGWTSRTQKVTIDSSGMVRSAADAGSLDLANLADNTSSAGPLDAIVEWALQGRTASLFYVPGNTWADRVLMASGLMEQPVASLAVGPSDDSKISIPLRDPRAPLDAPLQVQQFGGTNIGSAGVDGGTDIKGTPVPILMGLASDFPGVRVNEELLIWKLADRAVSIICARDGGMPIFPSVNRANVASLQANDPAPGFYDWVADTTGTYVRFGSTPIARVTFDAAEGTSLTRSHAQVWKRFREERCGTLTANLDAGDIAAVDASSPDDVGFWWASTMTLRDAMDQILGSLSGYEVMDENGVWHLRRLQAPSGSPVINLLRLDETDILSAIDRPIINLTRVRPNYAPNGAPPYRVNAQWGQNYTIMAEADFLGAAPQRLRDKFGVQWRTETAEDPTIWVPSTGAGLFPNAPELTISTGYQPDANGLTCTPAATEAARLLALYSGLKGQYQADFRPTPGDYILPGAVVSLTYSGFGLTAGPLFVVLQSGVKLVNKVLTATLVIGLQT